MARCCRIELLPTINDELVLFNVTWDKSPTAVLLKKQAMDLANILQVVCHHGCSLRPVYYHGHHPHRRSERNDSLGMGSRLAHLAEHCSFAG
jgi:hypothetical protein